MNLDAGRKSDKNWPKNVSQNSDFSVSKFPASSFRFQSSGFKFFGSKFLASKFRFQKFWLRFPVSKFRLRNFGFQHFRLRIFSVPGLEVFESGWLHLHEVWLFLKVLINIIIRKLLKIWLGNYVEQDFKNSLTARSFFD